MHIIDNSPFGPGVVGVISADDQVRFHHLLVSLDSLGVPTGSKYAHATGCNPAKNTNNLVDIMLGLPEMQWLWIMGDDHCFEPDALMRLLEHDKDCIMPLTLRRLFPWDAVLMKEFSPERSHFLWYTWEEIAVFNAPFVIAAGGTAGLLVKRRVFEHMPRPWFQVGTWVRDDLQEDIYFTWKANQMGHTVYCDPNVPMGHVTTAVIFPKHVADGQIGIATNMHGFKTMLVPPGYTAKRDENGDHIARLPWGGSFKRDMHQAVPLGPEDYKFESG